MKIDIIDLLRHNLMGIPLDVKISDDGKSHYEKYLTGMKKFFPPFSVKSTLEHIMWNVGAFLLLSFVTSAFTTPPLNLSVLIIFALFVLLSSVVKELNAFFYFKKHKQSIFENFEGEAEAKLAVISIPDYEGVFRWYFFGKAIIDGLSVIYAGAIAYFICWIFSRLAFSIDANLLTGTAHFSFSNEGFYITSIVIAIVHSFYFFKHFFQRMMLYRYLINKKSQKGSTATNQVINNIVD